MFICTFEKKRRCKKLTIYCLSLGYNKNGYGGRGGGQRGRGGNGGGRGGARGGHQQPGGPQKLSPQ